MGSSVSYCKEAEPVEAFMDTVSNKAKDLKQEGEKGIESLKQKGEQGFESAKQKGEELVGEAKDKASEAAGKAEGKAKDLKAEGAGLVEQGKEKAEAVKDEAKEKAKDVKDDAKELKDEAVEEAAGEEAEEKEGDVEDEEEEEEDAAPEVVVKTSPYDPRFPTTNQARACYTRYNEYYRCLSQKDEEDEECKFYAKCYRAICPGEWLEKWAEQRENGTWAGKY